MQFSPLSLLPPVQKSSVCKDEDGSARPGHSILEECKGRGGTEIRPHFGPRSIVRSTLTIRKWSGRSRHLSTT